MAQGTTQNLKTVSTEFGELPEGYAPIGRNIGAKKVGRFMLLAIDCEGQGRNSKPRMVDGVLQPPKSTTIATTGGNMTCSDGRKLGVTYYEPKEQTAMADAGI